MGDFDAADVGYGSTQCWDHPYRTTNSGGVCALCVRERLCKLIVSCSSESSLPLSSSFPSASSSSSSSTPSFHSRLSSSTSSSAHTASLRSRMSFLYYHMSKEKKKKKKTEVILRRTNSVAPSVVLHPMDDSPRRRWFWPFSVTHEKVGHRGAVRWNCREKVEENNVASLNKRSAEVVQVDKHLESTQTSERKVTRSRSVGCGNRSFSRRGFLERISTGSADCTYRRTESQRQGNYKDGSSRKILQQSSASSIVQLSDSMSTPFPSTHPPPPLVTLLWVPDKKADGVDTRLPAIKARSKEHGKGRGWAAAFATPMTSIRSYVAAYPTTPNRRRLFSKK